jgi:hypothetical protein
VVGSKLANEDGLGGKSDPYLVVHGKVSAEAEWSVLYQSEIVMDEPNPVWKPFQLDTINLFKTGESSESIRIDVLDWDANTSHDLIGCVTTTVRELQTFGQFEVLHPSKQRLPLYKNSGSLIIRKFEKAIATSHPVITFEVKRDAPPRKAGEPAFFRHDVVQAKAGQRNADGMVWVIRIKDNVRGWIAEENLE